MTIRPSLWLAFLALGFSTSATTEEPLTTRRIPQLENEAVKVWKSVIAPRQPLSMHRHEAGRVIVALVGGTLKVVTPAGQSRSMTWETGKAYWLGADPPGETHADVNEGDHTIEVMVIELKPKP